MYAVVFCALIWIIYATNRAYKIKWFTLIYWASLRHISAVAIL